MGIGAAYVVDRRRVQVPHTHIEPEQVDEELDRFRRAIRDAQKQLETIKSRLHHGEHRQILKAQQMMLRDPHLIQRTEGLIRDEAINAEWAVTKSTDEIRETLGRASDEYLAERQFDVAFMGEQLLRTLAGDTGGELAPPAGAIVVAHDLSPAETANLQRQKVAGIVTEAGGHTSHTAIMARALEIPAVVGLEGIIEQVETGDMVIVDGGQGRVLVRPEDEELTEKRGEAERYEAFEAKVQKEHALPAITEDGTHIVLRANLALEEEMESAMKHGAEGVGLYRTEYMYLGRDRLPSEEEHYRSAKAVLARCAPYPVVFRTFDLGSDKNCKLLTPEEKESNPALGLRSMRLALRMREHFLSQLRGLLRAGVHGPLRIMMPLISGPGELSAGLEAVEEARDQLVEAGMPHAEEVPVGIMIEVPSAALIADLLASRVDFMSIGTNDLIQYSLAIDRENDAVNYLYQPLHPAILRMIKMVIDAGKAANISVSLCGEMAADPRFTWVLAGLGLSEMSMNGGAIPVIKNIIRGSKLTDMQQLAQAVLETQNVVQARKLVVREMRTRFPEHLLHGAGSSSDPE